MNRSDTTTAERFGYIPASDHHLFEVRAGIDTSHAIGDADCLDEGVFKLLTDAVATDGMTPELVWLCRFAMDAAQALRSASGVTA